MCLCGIPEMSPFLNPPEAVSRRRGQLARHGSDLSDMMRVLRGRPEALYVASRRLLAMAGVRVRQHRLERPLMLQIGC